MIYHLNAEAMADLEAHDPHNPQLALWKNLHTRPAAIEEPIKNFWVVLRVRSKNFSEHIEFLEKPPMIFPREGHGEFAGVARNKAELDIMVGKDTHRYVYLVFQAKIQGRKSWRILLEFMGNNDMLSTFA